MMSPSCGSVRKLGLGAHLASDLGAPGRDAPVSQRDTIKIALVVNGEADLIPGR